MYKHILIATDGSAVGEKAVVQGLAIAKAFGAKVTAIKVTEMWSAIDMAGRDALPKIEKYEAAATATAQKVLEQVAATAKAAGVPCETLHVPDQVPADGILTTAKEKGCDLICMGSHGRRGLQRLLLGSQAHNVLNRTEISVMVCR